MPRLLLSDEHWSKLREILLHKAIYNKRDLRMTVEGMRIDCQVDFACIAYTAFANGSRVFEPPRLSRRLLCLSQAAAGIIA